MFCHTTTLHHLACPNPPYSLFIQLPQASIRNTRELYPLLGWGPAGKVFYIYSPGQAPLSIHWAPQTDKKLILFSILTAFLRRRYFAGIIQHCQHTLVAKQDATLLHNKIKKRAWLPEPFLILPTLSDIRQKKYKSNLYQSPLSCA